MSQIGSDIMNQAHRYSFTNSHSPNVIVSPVPQLGVETAAMVNSQHSPAVDFVCPFSISSSNHPTFSCGVLLWVWECYLLFPLRGELRARGVLKCGLWSPSRLLLPNHCLNTCNWCTLLPLPFSVLPDPSLVQRESRGVLAPLCLCLFGFEGRCPCCVWVCTWSHLYVCLNTHT